MYQQEIGVTKLCKMFIVTKRSILMRSNLKSIRGLLIGHLKFVFKIIQLYRRFLVREISASRQKHILPGLIVVNGILLSTSFFNRKNRASLHNVIGSIENVQAKQDLMALPKKFQYRKLLLSSCYLNVVFYSLPSKTK